ncbi:MAG: hypothetical protein JRH20_17490 [Deltaproteobacteria bacterium]|nr:hypothetical protein [Deltaproteobacteria bacterium]
MNKLMTMVALMSLVAGACGGDEQVSRFVDKTEMEMFEIVQEEVCVTVLRCMGETDGVDYANDADKMALCKKGLNDAQEYTKGGISAEDRAGLDRCLDDLSVVVCSQLWADSQSTSVVSCKPYESTYLDLK